MSASLNSRTIVTGLPLASAGSAEGHN